MRRSLLVLLMGAIAWTPQAYLFGAGEQGAHYEAYDPDSLLQRTNFATYTSKFDNTTGWPRVALLSVTPDADGVGDLLVPTTAATSHYVSASPSPLVAGGNYTVVIRAKAGGYDWLGVAMNVGTAYFNIATGALGSTGGVIGTPTIVAAPDAPGYYDITLVPNGAATLALYVANANAGFSFAGDGVSGIYIARIQVNKGTTALAYQDVTDWNTEYMAAALSSIGMWQDAVGVTPVTAVEQPVGRWMDTRFSMALGSELITVAADRDFSSDTGYWTKAGTVTIGSGACNFAATPNSEGISRSNLLTLGKVFEVTYTISAYTAGSVRAWAGNAGSIGTARSAAGTYTERLTCTGDAHFRIFATGGTTLSIDNVSIKEVTGNHATQGTSGQRPVLSARINQILASHAFTSASWVKAATATAPTATTLSFPANNDYVYQALSATLFSGKAATVSMMLSGVPGDTVRFGIYDGGGGGFTTGQDVVLTATPTQYTFSRTTLTHADQRFFIGRFTGNTATAVTIAWADARTGDDAAAANIPWPQRVNTATDYDTVGFPHYLKFDLFDDNLQAAGFDLSGTAKIRSWAGVTKLSDAAAQMIGEQTVNTELTNGGFCYFAPPSAIPNLYVGSRGTVSATLSVGGNAAPLTAVLSVAASIGTDALELFKDGASIGTTVTDQGAGNYANATHYIGRRGGTSAPFGGRLYTYTVRDDTNAPSAATLAAMNTYLGAKQGRTL